ncbi:unnamed protein product [Gadus morhua 'NCC']
MKLFPRSQRLTTGRLPSPRGLRSGTAPGPWLLAPPPPLSTRGRAQFVLAACQPEARGGQRSPGRAARSLPGPPVPPYGSQRRPFKGLARGTHTRPA